MDRKKMERLIDTDGVRFDIPAPYAWRDSLVRNLKTRVHRQKILSLVLKFATIEGFMIFILASAAL